MSDSLDPIFLPYGHQSIDESDVQAVAAALRDFYLTTGPKAAAFERAFARYVGAEHAVAVSSGTAALHLALLGLGIGEGDVCIVPSITFLATANAARYVGAEVVFADVDPGSGLMTPQTLEAALQCADGRRVRAILPVHMRGDVCDLPALRALADRVGAVVVEDAPHALGTETRFAGLSGRIGDNAYSAASCFSFHPVKTLTTGEGGMITTSDAQLAETLRSLRSHGTERPDGADPWIYEMHLPGFNYRLPDINCALGQSQLSRMDRFATRRRALTKRYQALLAPLAGTVDMAQIQPWCDPVLHLMTVLVDYEKLGISRADFATNLRRQGIGSQVHYIPVHTQPYYRQRYGAIDLPGAQAWYDRCLSLPLYVEMADQDVDRVVEAIRATVALAKYRGAPAR